MQTILVVDDCPAIAELLADLVFVSGYQSIVTGNGEDALSILENTEVDLILLDLDLPRLSGQSVVDRLAGDSALGRIPVIVVSGSLSALRRTPQVIAVIPKPFDVFEVQTAIARVLQSQRPSAGQRVAASLSV